MIQLQDGGRPSTKGKHREASLHHDTRRNTRKQPYWRSPGYRERGAARYSKETCHQRGSQRGIITDGSDPTLRAVLVSSAHNPGLRGRKWRAAAHISYDESHGP